MPVFPGQSNTYVPKLTNRLRVDFSRNQADFPLNRYVQIVPLYGEGAESRQTGYFLRMTREQAGRINTNGNGTLWADGNDRPDYNGNLESFDLVKYTTRRRTDGIRAGDLSINQGDYDVVGHNTQATTERMMRLRTQLTANVMANAANYAGSNTAASTAAGYGAGTNWSAATPANPVIKRCIDAMVKQVTKSTLNSSQVKKSNLRLVLNLNMAQLISETQEIITYLQGSPFALDWLRGQINKEKLNQETFGAPVCLYGVELVVEDTWVIPSKKGAATTTVQQAWPDGVAVLACQPGSLVAERADDAPSFSTCALLMKEEMTVDVERSDWNRVTKAGITEDYVPVLCAPASGFCMTGIA
jgi:hypothetical protein